MTSNSESVVALLPMRGGSERVRNKNLRLLADRPLYTYMLDTLLDLDFCQEVFVDTDSDAIEAAVRSTHPDVRVYRRPVSLGSGDTPMTDVILDFLGNFSFDRVLQVHSTSPFLCSSSLKSAYKVLRSDPGCDSVFSVTSLQARLWTEELAPINHNPAFLERTQDLSPILLENSGFYLLNSDVIRATRNRIGRSPKAVRINTLEALDIDTEDDFNLAQFVATGLNLRNPAIKNGGGRG